MTQSKMTPEQAKALLESLFALPDATKSKKAAPTKTKAAAKPTDAPTSKIPPSFKPALMVVEHIVQSCTTCGSTHEHIRSRRIRFESKDAKAIEVQVSIPPIEELPRRIDMLWETTNICPTCIRANDSVDTWLESLTQGPTQLELFHG
jgi:hypothetical protein